MRSQWVEFCRALTRDLSSAGHDIVASAADEVDRIDGLRVLLRDLRMSIERQVEDLDRDHPFFTELIRETYHLVGDCPDYTIHMARLDPDRAYVITGTRGTAARFTLTTQGPVAGEADHGAFGVLHDNARYGITGTLDDDALSFDDAGRFEVTVSREPPSAGAWLPMGPETTVVLVRNEFHAAYAVHRRTAPTKLHIRRAGPPTRPVPLGQEALSGALEAIRAEVGAATLARRRLFTALADRGAGFVPDDSTWSGNGGNPRTVFQAGSWRLGPDEALLIDVDRVPRTSFWALGLTNAWMESLDFRFQVMNLNQFTARYEPDGGLRIVVSHEDPGRPNWLDTGGHRRGGLMWRWNHPETPPPVPRTRVVPAASVLGPQVN